MILSMVSCQKESGCVVCKFRYSQKVFNDTTGMNCDETAVRILEDIYGEEVWYKEVMNPVMKQDSSVVDTMYVKCVK